MRRLNDEKLAKLTELRDDAEACALTLVSTVPYDARLARVLSWAWAELAVAVMMEQAIREGERLAEQEGEADE